MKNLTTFLVGVLIMLHTNAQNSTIKGTITESDSLTPIAYANIMLKGTSHGTISKGNGSFIIENVEAGTYTIEASFLGYHSISKEITVKNGETLTYDFSMIESIVELNTLVIQRSITGGKVGIKDMQGSAYYISPKEIKKFNYTDINRTLRSVPGINIQEEDGFGLRPNIGLRGTGAERSSKITLMEDGVLMAPAPYAAPAAYYFPTIGRMQAIEILKGSSQIKYGPYTTGGAINLISTQLPNKFSGRLYTSVGNFGTKNLHAFVGDGFKNVAFLVETFQYQSDGFKVLDNGGNTGFDKKDYLAKLRINSNPKAKYYQSLTLKVGQTLESSNETYLGLTENDFIENPYRRYAGSQEDIIRTEQSQYSATHYVKFSKNIDVNTTAYRTDFHRNWYKLNKVKDSTGVKYSISDLLDNPEASVDAFNILTGETSSNEDALELKANNRTYYAQGIQTVLGMKFQTKKINHKIDLGLRVHQDQVDRFQWVDEYAMDDGVMELKNSGIHGTESNRVETATAIASYIQYQIRYKKMTITPGVRYENIFISRSDYGKNDPKRTGTDIIKRTNNTNVFIPGLGVDYKVNKYLSFFGGIHKGFSPPGSKEGTQPETSINYELGTRYSKKAINLQFVAFYNDYDNLLGSDLNASGGAGTNQLFNGGAVVAKGLEVQATYDLISKFNLKYNLPISIAYTLTDATFLSDFESDFEGWGEVKKGDELPYFAHNQFSIIMGLEHKKFDVNLSGKYIDEMRTKPGQNDFLANEKTDSYFVIDASVSYKPRKYISIFSNVSNVTNEVYIVARRPSGLRPGLARAVTVGLKADF